MWKKIDKCPARQHLGFVANVCTLTRTWWGVWGDWYPEDEWMNEFDLFSGWVSGAFSEDCSDLIHLLITLSHCKIALKHHIITHCFGIKKKKRDSGIFASLRMNTIFTKPWNTVHIYLPIHHLQTFIIQHSRRHSIFINIKLKSMIKNILPEMQMQQNSFLCSCLSV